MKKAVKRVLASVYFAANRQLGPLVERLLALVADRRPGPADRPIFIIGAPRSGTTLTFQLMVSAFRLGYLTNTHCLTFGAPALASYFLGNRDRHIAFTSDYGRTSGRHGPSECGEWWYRFFPRDPAYVTRRDMPAKALDGFRRSLRLVGRAEGRPLVFKNLYAGLRLDPIAAVFPGAIFIHVQRNRGDNAISILEGRMAANGSYEPWWSVTPPGHEDWIGKPAAEQAMAQIALIDRQIAKDMRALGIESQVLSVNYDEICADPGAFLIQVQTFLAARQLVLPMVAAPPQPFARRPANRLPQEMIAAIRALDQGTARDA